MADRYRQEGGWQPWTDSDYTRLLPIVTPAARLRGSGGGWGR